MCPRTAATAISWPPRCRDAKDGIAIQLGATSGSGGVTLRKVVDKLDSGGGMISLDIGALTQGHGLTNSMLSITVAGAGGKSLGGAGAIGVNLSRTEVQAVIDNNGAAAGTQLRADAGRVSVSAQDSSRIVTATGAGHLPPRRAPRLSAPRSAWPT